jgi:hypothetical protein
MTSSSTWQSAKLHKSPFEVKIQKSKVKNGPPIAEEAFLLSEPGHLLAPQNDCFFVFDFYIFTFDFAKAS